MTTNQKAALTHQLIWAAVCVVALAVFARCAIHLVSYNYNLAAEANGLYGVLEVSDGRSLYAPKDQTPYHIYLYPPLHAIVTGNLARILPTDWLHSKIMFVRFLSLAFLVLSLILWWRVVLKPEGVTAPLIALALALSMHKFSDYATTTRNDMFALWFEILAACSFISWLRSPRQFLQTVRWILPYAVFIALAALTRHTGILVVAATTTWFLLRRKWKWAIILAFGQAIWIGTLYLLVNHHTEGAFFEGAFLANLRGFRPVNRQFLDISLISFGLSYIAYLAFVLLGFGKKVKDDTDLFLKIYFVEAFLFASAIFLRAGGDVNYFFEALFVGTVFCCRGLNRIHLSKHSTLIRTAIGAQLVLIGALYTLKTRSAFKLAFLPYASAAEKVRAIEPHGLLVGQFGASLGIYLRGWSLHGPDITNTSEVARNGHEKLRWILRDLEKAVAQGEVSSIVMAQNGCDERKRYWTNLPVQRGTFREFKNHEVLLPWLCVYKPTTG